MTSTRRNGIGEPLLDIISYGRAAPENRGRLTPAQIDYIRRTVSRTPEVMIKVTGGGGSTSTRGVSAHFNYIGRRGDLEIETDDGERLKGREATKDLIDYWDLDLEQARKRSDLFATHRGQPPKLVHRLVFSMPAGTPPDKVLSAVRVFAREEFGLKHRYAMVLHTDEPHPHVHVVVKAMSEDGQRLNIRKTTLRDWRQEFARRLREQGVAANATERAVRGRSGRTMKDGVYRSALRRDSRRIWRLAEEAANAIAERRTPVEAGKAALVETRRGIERGWHAVAQSLNNFGQPELAWAVSNFMQTMRPPRTDRELMMEQLLKAHRERNAERTR